VGPLNIFISPAANFYFSFSWGMFRRKTFLGNFSNLFIYFFFFESKDQPLLYIGDPLPDRKGKFIFVLKAFRGIKENKGGGSISTVTVGHKSQTM
jgi:hypothetical protein